DAETAAREELSLLAIEPRPARITADGARIGPFDGTGRDVELLGVRVRVPMPGEHHARLAALAIATALALGRTPRTIEEGFASFVPPPGRARIARLDRDVVLVDDTFNASPGSMRAAIALAREPAWSARPKALFLGDMLDLGDASARAHMDLVSELAALTGAHVRLFGDEMRRVADALSSSSTLASIAHAPSSADPTTLLDGVWASLEGALVIVKGSRGMRLERIANAIARAYSRPRPLPDRPSFAGDFFTIGVTGTNGKTSTTTFASRILSRAHSTNVVRATTLGYFIGAERLDHPLDFDGFVAALGEAHARGIRHAVLEVTSEALQHGFAKVWPFRVGVFTNLTHDHLDVHTTAEHYLASKAQLFMNLERGGAAVLNACDPASALLREVVPAGVAIFSYGVASRGEPEGDVDLFVREFRPGTPVAVERSARLRDFPSPIELRAPSAIFVENALAAALGAFASGVSASEIALALAEAEPPRGRFERVRDVPRVFVDYAHTPDALARTIAAGRAIAHENRVIVVFGAGGDRDTRKREPMGRAASAADVVFLTNDNPRTEDPAAIAADIARGLRDHPNVIVELDRARAIAMAITEARDDDVVLVCGKGHETDQIIGTKRLPFSDHEIVKLSARNPGNS
ncbi:MAG TPA: UDP-N-acetylmuramyl-tripeptide synthetase, partial [Polyangiaceae bacterium]|nr:UDP-N-acetylmuramyl-tripeptide synthetase [Polyangiaceae bacterium]